MIRGRLRRRPGDGERARADEEFVDIDPAELTGVFATPPWLRDLGLTAWLLVGVALFLAGSVWLLSLTQDDRHSGDHRRGGRGGGLTAG